MTKIGNYDRTIILILNPESGPKKKKKGQNLSRISFSFLQANSHRVILKANSEEKEKNTLRHRHINKQVTVVK